MDNQAITFIYKGNTSFILVNINLKINLNHGCFAKILFWLKDLRSLELIIPFFIHWIPFWGLNFYSILYRTYFHFVTFYSLFLSCLSFPCLSFFWVSSLWSNLYIFYYLFIKLISVHTQFTVGGLKLLIHFSRTS